MHTHPHTPTLGTDKSTGFEPLQKVDAHNTYILKCLLSPDPRYLATCSADKTIKIWNVDKVGKPRGAREKERRKEGVAPLGEVRNKKRR